MPSLAASLKGPARSDMMRAPEAPVSERPPPRTARWRRIGERVRRYREEHGWTQRQLAAKASVSQGTVSRVELGLERPVLRTASALAEALGVTTEQLLGLAGQPSLFPLPDERRMALIRRVVAMDDDDFERAWPQLEAALEATDDARPRARRSRRAESRGPE